MTGGPVVCFVGLGSNLENPEQQVNRAFHELADLPQTSLSQKSSLYRSPPLGPEGQPDYINAVASLRTGLVPIQLLDLLQQIEQAHRRVRRQRWGPRTLDLDLLLYGDQRIETGRLTVPHPEMHRRAFVLMPLSEIAPELVIAEKGTVTELLASVGNAGVRRHFAEKSEKP